MKELLEAERNELLHTPNSHRILSRLMETMILSGACCELFWGRVCTGRDAAPKHDARKRRALQAACDIAALSF